MGIEDSAMEVEQLLPSPSRKKHRSSSPPGGGADDEVSKRRKHRHHRHRHHRHRHHSRKHRDGEDASRSKPAPVADDEPEEGEILEEDDGARAAAALAGSDAESGEIKSDLCHNMATSGEDTSFSDKDLEAVDGNLGARKKIDAVPAFADPIVKKGKIPVLEGEREQNSKASRARRDEVDSMDCDTSNGDFTTRARSRSPVSGDTLHAENHRNREDKPRSRGGTGRSPSRNGRHHRDLPSSRDTEDQHRVRGQTGNAEMDRRDRERSNSQSRRDIRADRRDRETIRTDTRDDRDRDRERETDRVVRKDRERSASYSRHEGREGRHANRDRESDLDKGHRGVRGRSSSISSRHDRPEDRHRDKERERQRREGSVRDKERERREGSVRDRERDRKEGSVRDREREIPRDLTRDRSRERDRARDAYRERDKERERDSYDRSRSRVSDRDGHLDKGRDHGRQMDRERANYRDRDRDSRHTRYDERDHYRDRKRSKESGKAADGEKEESIREEDEEDYQEKIEQQLAKQDEEDPDKIKEESRKRRQAILEKYKQIQPQQHVESPSTDNGEEDKAAATNDNLQDPDAKDGQAVSAEIRQDSSDVYVAEPSFTVGKSPMKNGTSSPDARAGVGGLGEGSPKSERSADMFCDDIFGESPVGVRKAGKGDGLQIERSGLHDNWDDAEGYYSYRFGEVLDGRYEVIAAHGKGVFSTVVRAKDLKAGKGDPEEVAIKIIRNNDTMYKAGLEELIILKKLVGADPEDKRHCVRFLSSFKYRNHLCLVFESLHMNLREVLKKFGRNIGLRLTAVRAYAKQLFIALKHLRNCGVLHCDIKPDNMLVNEAKNVLKLCDFGNAMFAGKNEITPYLVSRFYRSPEIILGLPYDHPMDIWSVGCCLYELYSGKVLFPGPSNNDMLRLHMELKGTFPKKMLRKGAFVDQHFDQDLNFHATEEDPVTRKTVKRLLMNIKPKDISALVSSSPGEDPKMLANFKDLLDRVFVLDPEKRMTVSQALSHPFITGK
ncbi:serine/threonine-protein kinase prpf4B isoform X1 [Iris pallida]|uniref:Serine/threonine-protein kinase PRP4 homolog n=1 Tax=Iris pallida TaxID=29817 RepID=A0AAX6I7W3_IRIPA|nr:serine/threonine-protein kinase prpf4B isoform X1 [Iris pallida]